MQIPMISPRAYRFDLGMVDDIERNQHSGGDPGLRRIDSFHWTISR